MTPKIYQTLEFDQIIQAINRYTSTDYGHQLITHVQFSTDLEQLDRKQDEIEEALSLIHQKTPLPLVSLERLHPIIHRLKIGASLNGKELAALAKLLTTMHQLTSFFERLAEDDKFYPALMHWVDQAVDLPEPLAWLDRTVEESGEIKTSASNDLSRIRRTQVRTEEQIRQSLNHLVKTKANQLSDQLITIRNDRYVLPVKAEYRRAMGGTVHDQSSTGQTLYIEPQQIVRLNNRLSELRVEEKNEIDRLLMELSQALMPYVDEFEANESVCGQLDAINAKALYARDTNATRPKFSPQRHVAIWQAHHPLIDPDESVANDLLIGDQYQTLLITGPNTGGKTILLKTLGLMQLMGQCGLHIPAQAGSQLGIFDGVYADIGDEQSIEQSLSTFSSHMTNIVSILEEATSQSLILFDELGSGTDPQEGAALAMAILNYTTELKATVMATTHYPELKVYAHEASGTINASMEFDSETLSPTYRLLIGIPGRSNALEISQRLGLAPSILKEAREGISTDSHSINELVANLERERREVELKLEKANTQLDEAEQLHKDLSAEYHRWLEQKDQINRQARKEANDEIKQAQEEANKIIQEIRDLQLEQGQNQTIKEHVLIDKKSALDDLQVPEEVATNRVLRKNKAKLAFKPGEDVEVLTYGQRGTIISQLNANEYEVQMGILKMKVAAKDLRPIQEQKSKNKQPVTVRRQSVQQVPPTLDLRGQRYDQALRELSQYLDSALLSNHPRVTIIHGKGTGALRKGVQQALRNHSQVDRFEFAPPNIGGNGATLVYFKE